MKRKREVISSSSSESESDESFVVSDSAVDSDSESDSDTDTDTITVDELEWMFQDAYNDMLRQATKIEGPPPPLMKNKKRRLDRPGSLQADVAEVLDEAARTTLQRRLTRTEAMNMARLYADTLRDAYEFEPLLTTILGRLTKDDAKADDAKRLSLAKQLLWQWLRYQETCLNDSYSEMFDARESLRKQIDAIDAPAPAPTAPVTPKIVVIAPSTTPSTSTTVAATPTFLDTLRKIVRMPTADVTSRTKAAIERHVQTAYGSTTAGRVFHPDSDAPIPEPLCQDKTARQILQYIAKLPFGRYAEPITTPAGETLRRARAILDDRVSFMDDVKDAVMQLIAVMLRRPDRRGLAIALHGPVGTGKTRIGSAIAQALGRRHRLIALGGMRHACALRGSSSVWQGSEPGAIVNELIHAQTMDTLFQFDELDKLSKNHEEITATLIHLTDESQNARFEDEYLAGVELDLSGCIFLFNFNYIADVNPVLLDRLNVIHVRKQTLPEMQEITRRHILRDVLRECGLDAEDVVVSDAGIDALVRRFHDRGCRTVKRVLGSIVKRVNLDTMLAAAADEGGGVLHLTDAVIERGIRDYATASSVLDDAPPTHLYS